MINSFRVYQFLDCLSDVYQILLPSYLMEVGCDGRGGGEAAPGVAAAGGGRRLQVQEGQDQTPSRRLQGRREIYAKKSEINRAEMPLKFEFKARTNHY